MTRDVDSIDDRGQNSNSERKTVEVVLKHAYARKKTAERLIKQLVHKLVHNCQ